MKTVIFWHFDVIEIILALNYAPGRKEDVRTTSRKFSGHRYGGSPPVPSAHTMCQEHHLVKYFHLPQTDQRPDTHSSVKSRNTAQIRSQEETWRKEDSGCHVDPRRTRHHPLHHQPLHHQPHSPPTIVVILIAIVDLYLNLFHSLHPLHKIMMMFLIASMCE